MADEDLSVAETGLETATEQTQQAVEEPTTPEPEQQEEGAEPETGEGEGEIADDLEEIEVDGQSYRVPKDLKGAFMRNADYTQKSQANAETKRTLDARATELEERSKATDEELRDRARLIDIESKLSQYENVDWVNFARTDPAGYNEHSAYFNQLQREQQAVKAAVDTKTTERTQKAQQDFAKRVEETLSFVNDPKNGFKPDSIKTLVEFAQSEGIPDETIQRNWSPQLVTLLRKAHVGHLAMTKQISTPKPAPKTPEPLRIVAAKSNPTNRKTISQMSVADHSEQIKKEQAQRRA